MPEAMIGNGTSGATFAAPPYALAPRVFQVEDFGASPNASAVTNTRAFQAALDQVVNCGGGSVQLTTPGRIRFNGNLQYSSNTHIRLGGGTELYLDDGVSQPMFQNRNMASTGVTVVSFTFGPLIGTGFFIVTADCGAVPHGLIAGRYGLIKGDTTQQYNSVVRVLSTPNAFTFTYLVCAKVAYTAPAGTVTVRECEFNVCIEGGTLNYNGINNPYVTGVRAQAILANNIGAFRLQNITMVNVTKWLTNVGNAHGVYMGNIDGDTASDGPHLCGNVTDFIVENIRGVYGDDVVALQGDPASFVASEAILGGDQIGAFKNGIIRNLTIKRTSENLVASYPATAYGMQNILIDGIECIDTCRNLVYLAGFVGDVMSNISRFQISNLKGEDWTSNMVRIGANATSIAIDEINIEGLDAGTKGQTTQLVNITNTQVAGSINVNKVRVNFDIASGANRQVLGLNDATCSVGAQIRIDEVDGYTSGAGASAQLLTVVGAQTFDVFIGERVNLKGNFHTLNNAPTGNARFNISGQFESYFVLTNSTLASIDVTLRASLRCLTPGGNAPLNLTGNAKTYNVVIDAPHFGNATNWLACGTNSTYHLDVSKLKANPASTVPGISLANPCTVFLSSADPRTTIKTDTAGLTFTARTGAIYNDTQAAAAGIYLKGPTAAPLRIAT